MRLIGVIASLKKKRYQKVAYDPVGSEMLHLHVTMISFGGKRILAGFVRTFFTGSDAKRFHGWTMGSGNGPSELMRLVHSITKEEKGTKLPAGSPKATELKRS